MDKKNSLAILNQAEKLLVKATTIQETKELKDLFLTARDWAERKGLGKEVIQHAQAYAWLAERKLGQMLKMTDRHKGGRPKKTGSLKEPVSIPKLKELGLTKKESLEANLVADVSEEISNAVKEGKKSRQAVINEERRKKKREELKAKSLIPGEKKYRIVYADPPWKYDQWLPHQYGDAEKIFPTKTIQEICDMPVKEMIEEDAVLFLWITSPKLEQAFKIIKAWGFEYKTSFVWDKIKHNFGYYNSVRHEFLLIGGRGSSTPDSKKLYDSVVSIERSKKHSEKPEFFRDMIDKLYTWGNRIELFHRGELKNGWDGFGNE